MHSSLSAMRKNNYLINLIWTAVFVFYFQIPIRQQIQNTIFIHKYSVCLNVDQIIIPNVITTIHMKLYLLTLEQDIWNMTERVILLNLDVDFLLIAESLIFIKHRGKPGNIPFCILMALFPKNCMQNMLLMVMSPFMTH